MTYRMIDDRMWRDPQMRTLGTWARTVVAFLMTGPVRTVLPGLIPIGRVGLAEAMGAPHPEVLEAILELEHCGWVEVDDSVPLLRLVPAPDWDSPVSKRVLAAWRRLLCDLPRVPVVVKHLPSLYQAAKGRCAETDIRVAFAEFLPLMNSSGDLDRVSIGSREGIDRVSHTLSIGYQGQPDSVTESSNSDNISDSDDLDRVSIGSREGIDTQTIGYRRNPSPPPPPPPPSPAYTPPPPPAQPGSARGVGGKHPDQQFTDNHTEVDRADYSPSQFIWGQAATDRIGREIVEQALGRYRETAQQRVSTQRGHDAAFKSFLKTFAAREGQRAAAPVSAPEEPRTLEYYMADPATRRGIERGYELMRTAREKRERTNKKS